MFDSNQRARIIYSPSDLPREKNSSSAVARRNLKVDELFQPVSNDFFARSSSKKTSTRHLSVVGRKIRKIQVEASKCVTRKEKRPCVDASRGKKSPFLTR